LFELRRGGKSSSREVAALLTRSASTTSPLIHLSGRPDQCLQGPQLLQSWKVEDGVACAKPNKGYALMKAYRLLALLWTPRTSMDSAWTRKGTVPWRSW